LFSDLFDESLIVEPTNVKENEIVKSKNVLNQGNIKLLFLFLQLLNIKINEFILFLIDFDVLLADDFQSTVLGYLAKISVDIGEINKTLNRHEDILNTTSFGNRTNESSSSDYINQHYSALRFPIQNMTELELCEEYLTDNTFKLKMVSLIIKHVLLYFITNDFFFLF